jgi:thiol-disulfide isomerase/thioredoxin
MFEMWKATLRQGGRPWPLACVLGAWAAAAVMVVQDRMSSVLLGLLTAPYVMVALSGLLSRGAPGPSAPAQSVRHYLWGRFLGALSLGLGFIVILYSLTYAIGWSRGHGLTFADGLSLVSGLCGEMAWQIAVLFFFSALVARRIDVLGYWVLVLLARVLERIPFGAQRWEVGGRWLSEQLLNPVWISSLEATGLPDVFRWSSNLTLAILGGVLLFRRRPAGSRLPFPRLLATLALLLLVGRLTAPALLAKIQWVTAPEAPMVAQGSGKPILYVFSAAWCAPCRRLDREVFHSHRYAALVNQRFVPVQVVDREREEGQNPLAVRELQDRYQVPGFPTLVVARADGSQLSQRVGVRGGGVAVARFLEQALQAATEEVPPTR